MSSSSGPESEPLLCITPPNLSLSFQEGFLGAQPACIKGVVELKWPNEANAIDRIEVVLVGTERSQVPHSESTQEVRFFGGCSEELMLMQIELYSQRKQLWSGSDPSSSQHPTPPNSLPFSLDLTSDLPHCIHAAPRSSLEYTLKALCYLADNRRPPVSYQTPIHMTRYSSESSACCMYADAPDHSPSTCTNGPAYVELGQPTLIRMHLSKTAFRRSEPIPVRVQIQPPEPHLIEEKGLRLRSVSLSLIRRITSVLLSESYEHLLCHSGKSARFSPTRPLNLYLAIPQRSKENLPCESISQSTILHTISFSLRLTVTLSSREAADRQDIILDKEVSILPDLPVATTRKSEKQKAADTFASHWDHRGAAPTYTESVAGPSTAAGDAVSDSDSEVEYDGFEESVSAEADAMLHAAPSIDSDVSPPPLIPEDTLIASQRLSIPGERDGDLPLGADYAHIDGIESSSIAIGLLNFPDPPRSSADEGSDLSSTSSTIDATQNDDPPSYSQNSISLFARPPPYGL